MQDSLLKVTSLFSQWWFVQYPTGLVLSSMLTFSLHTVAVLSFKNLLFIMFTITLYNTYPLTENKLNCSYIPKNTCVRGLLETCHDVNVWQRVILIGQVLHLYRGICPLHSRAHRFRRGAYWQTSRILLPRMRQGPQHLVSHLQYFQQSALKVRKYQ